jgi:deoxyribonuclease V
MSNVQELLRNDYSIEQAEAVQMKYQNLITQLTGNKNFTTFNSIKKIVGVDISYYKKVNNDFGVACAVVWDLSLRKIESYYFAHDQIDFPYKPGFLGFRECKLLAELISKLPDKPNLVMCDGHGKIHPRRFGEAVHLGFALNIPTIGIAKNPYIGYYKWHNIQLIKGNKSPIWANNPEIVIGDSSNELLGYAICLKNGSKPVYISTGYNIKIETALRVCLETTKEHRQPEPLYLADKLSRKEVSNYL